MPFSILSEKLGHHYTAREMALSVALDFKIYVLHIEEIYTFKNIWIRRISKKS